ncbi:hypothetical protein ACQZV8_09295 [Magnetococcales bacterium HHB-1]
MINRRQWLGQLYRWSLFSLFTPLLSCAHRTTTSGVIEKHGDVKINQKAAKRNKIIQPGDTLTTGAESHATVVIGADIFLLRPNSHFRWQPPLWAQERSTVNDLPNTIPRHYFLYRGGVLATFAKGLKQIHTPVAVLDIRGSAAYAETSKEKSYLCLCYGEAELSLRHSPIKRQIKTLHHEQPIEISRSNQRWQVEPAPGRENHFDHELIDLEQKMNRIPPFLAQKNSLWSKTVPYS